MADMFPFLTDASTKGISMTQTATTTRTFEGLEIPAPGTYSYDVGHSHVGFAVRHLMVAKTRGRFTSFGGSLVIADDPLNSSIDVTIDVASVDSHDEQRDGHLRSADFFDAEQLPHHPLREHRRPPRRRFGLRGRRRPDGA